MKTKFKISVEDLSLRNAWLKHYWKPLTANNVLSNWPKHLDHIRIEPIRQALHNACTDIYKSLLEPNLYRDLDSTFTVLASYGTFKDPVTGTMFRVSKPQQVANFLASLCAECAIYWDDLYSDKTAEEIKYFKENTMWGQTLDAYEVFVSQDPTLKQKPNNSKPVSSNNQGVGNNASNSSGTYSSKSGLDLTSAHGLVDTNKYFVNNQPSIFWIKGKFNTNGKTSPRVHVSPLKNDDPCIVKYSSGQGYDDCILYFEDITEADTFLKQVHITCTDPKIDPNGWVIKKTLVDKNGYFKINTNLGPALILAKKLHEALEGNTSQEEALEEIAMPQDDWNNRLHELLEFFN